MKKEIVLSTLLLASNVSMIPQSVYAQINKEITSSISSEERFNLKGESSIRHQGKDLTISLNLEKGAFEMEGANKLVFELMGSIVFKNGEEYYGHFGAGDADGNTVFEMTNDDEYGTEYLGFSCTSTWRACEVTDIIKLYFSKKDQSWSISLLGKINGDEQLSLESLKLSTLP